MKELYDAVILQIKYDAVSGKMYWIDNGMEAGGRTSSNGYLNIKFNGKMYLAHRIAWFIVNGEFPDGQIDHIDHDKHNNRMSNLRDVDASDNLKNKGKYKCNTSKTTGVYWYKDRSSWSAKIRINSKLINLGFFDEYHEAVNARKNAEVLYGFHENHGKDK